MLYAYGRLRRPGGLLGEKINLPGYFFRLSRASGPSICRTLECVGDSCHFRLYVPFYLQAVGNAPSRAYHSCNMFNGELLVFGGVFPNPDPQPDGCSNELYIFNTSAKNWYKPITSGTPPNPKSGYLTYWFIEQIFFKIMSKGFRATSYFIILGVV